MFKVINYSNKNITAQVGFYSGTTKTILVKAATTAIESIPSQYNCTATTDYGTGRVFILFPKDPAAAGANYSPSQNSVNLMGRLAGANNGRIVQTDDGTLAWLTTSGVAVDDNKFEVTVGRTKQANGLVAGTN